MNRRDHIGLLPIHFVHLRSKGVAEVEFTNDLCIDVATLAYISKAVGIFDSRELPTSD